MQCRFFEVFDMFSSCCLWGPRLEIYRRKWPSKLLSFVHIASSWIGFRWFCIFPLVNPPSGGIYWIYSGSWWLFFWSPSKSSKLPFEVGWKALLFSAFRHFLQDPFIGDLKTQNSQATTSPLNIGPAKIWAMEEAGWISTYFDRVTCVMQVASWFKIASGVIKHGWEFNSRSHLVNGHATGTDWLEVPTI